jgi:ubiquinol oxidase
VNSERTLVSQRNRDHHRERFTAFLDKEPIMNTEATTQTSAPVVMLEGDTHLPQNWLAANVPHWQAANGKDRFALAMTKLLRAMADLCFRQHYIHRAVVLETVAAVPGMVGAVLQHLRALRIFHGRPDMVKLLLDEAENERMHLMAFVAMSKPNWFERVLIVLAQGVFFNAFFLLYLISPATAHRLVGYFEEEAVVSYSRFLQAIDAGEIGNRDIPDFARQYWKLAPEARLRELVIAIRADEMNHRDVNHHLGNELA